MNVKKQIFTCLLTIICTSVCGQAFKELSMQFDKKDFSFAKQGMYTHIIPQKTNMVVWGDTIDPALPYLGVNVLINPTEEYDGITIESNNELVQTDVVIAPNPIPMPTNRIEVSEKTRHVEYKKAVYPNANMTYTGTHLMDGYKYLSFVVCPFAYDATKKELFIKKKMDIKIRLKEHGSQVKTSGSIKIKHPGKNMRNLIKEITVNGDKLEKLYPQTTMSKISTSSLKTNPSYDYVIITDSTLLPCFKKLAQWKNIKGVRTKVLTTDECYSDYPNDTPQMAIKKSLKYYYEEGMTYALLGGDVDVVPTQTCYIQPHTIDTNNMPTDLFYACLDKVMSWDSNNNQIYAELSDSIDLAPEFIVSRLSVSTTAEAETIINRIIEYESSPMTKGWNKSMLSCGNVLYNYKTKNNMQISDAQWQGEYVYENSVQPYWNGNFFELFDTYTDHQAGANYEANASHLQSELEKGYAFVDEFSHGWINNWGQLENGSIYFYNMAEELYNSNYTIITTISCYSNAYDLTPMDTITGTGVYPVCMSEAFIRNPHSGVLAYFGSSREGWSGTSYYFDKKFYESLFSGNDKHFGTVAQNARIAFLGNVSPNFYNYYRWLIMSLNPLGDTEMPIFTDTPQSFSNIVVSFSNGTLSISTGVDSCRICISSVTDNGNSHYDVYNNVSTGSYNGIDEDCYLCITKQGYVPYVARVGRTVYLQNENINLKLPIFSDNTYIGSNVTTTRPEGQVIVEKGKIVNVSQENCVIENDFEVKVGAEMDIKMP